MNEIIEFLRFKELAVSLFKAYPQRMFIAYNGQLQQQYPEFTKNLQKYYHRLTQKTLDIRGGCSNCVVDAIIYLNSLSLQKIINRMQLKHKIKEGILIRHKGEFYTKDSPHLTNEICEEIYKDSGMYYFESYDENWKETTEKIEAPDIDNKVTADMLEKFFIIHGKPEPEAEPEPHLIDFDSMQLSELKNYASRVEHKLKSRKKADIINELKAI